MRTPDGKNYALGRGKLFFAPYAPGTTQPTGQRYFGNTPEFTQTSDSEELEHFDSDNGINVKDDAVTLSNTRTGAFTTDNINLDNVAMFFLGDKSTFTQTANTAVTEEITIKRGHYYQLGATDENPAGVRHITNVTFTGDGGTAIELSDNFELDMELGRFYVEADAPGVTGEVDVTVTYDQAAYTQNRVVSSSNEIVGELYFECTNPKGLKFDYFWPYVKISPNGDFNLKSGDDWMVLPFNIEFLQKSGMETVYITDRGVTAP